MEQNVRKYCIDCQHCHVIFYFNMDLSLGDSFDPCRDGLVTDGDATRIGMMCFCKKQAENARFAYNVVHYLWIDSSELEKAFGEQLNHVLAVGYSVTELPPPMKKYTDEYVANGLFKCCCENQNCPFYAERRLEEWNEE